MPTLLVNTAARFSETRRNDPRVREDQVFGRGWRAWTMPPRHSCPILIPGWARLRDVRECAPPVNYALRKALSIALLAFATRTHSCSEP